jgi:NCS2 family nucleobase:cation symporter-2
VAFIISADLFACGLATVVQNLGFPAVGIRLPVMMGVTFASVGPMLSMAASPEIGLLGIYGALIRQVCSALSSRRSSAVCCRCFRRL